MIAWVNLRGVLGDSDGVPTRLNTPDWPAVEHELGNVVFVHGYNMAEDAEVPLWAANVFKKLWWAGLDRGFVAVQWVGNEGQMYVPFVGWVTPNYYGNVQNAFATAPVFKNTMDGIGGPKWFLAHSLGNMLVSAAIHDYNYDMAILFTSGQSDLPQNGEDMDEKYRDWQHSTFVQRSYKRVHQLYKEIIHHIKEYGNE
jgi:hypothetical protein